MATVLRALEALLLPASISNAVTLEGEPNTMAREHKIVVKKVKFFFIILVLLEKTGFERITGVRQQEKDEEISSSNSSEAN